MELQRSLRAWLELQSNVNALIDSTTAPDKGVSVRDPGSRAVSELYDGLAGSA